MNLDTVKYEMVSAKYDHLSVMFYLHGYLHHDGEESKPSVMLHIDGNFYQFHQGVTGVANGHYRPSLTAAKYWVRRWIRGGTIEPRKRRT